MKSMHEVDLETEMDVWQFWVNLSCRFLSWKSWDFLCLWDLRNLLGTMFFRHDLVIWTGFAPLLKTTGEDSVRTKEESVIRSNLAYVAVHPVLTSTLSTSKRITAAPITCDRRPPPEMIEKRPIWQQVWIDILRTDHIWVPSTSNRWEKKGISKSSNISLLPISCKLHVNKRRDQWNFDVYPFK